MNFFEFSSHWLLSAIEDQQNVLSVRVRLFKSILRNFTMLTKRRRVDGGDTRLFPMPNYWTDTDEMAKK